jgi:hypothetical protein
MRPRARAARQVATRRDPARAHAPLTKSMTDVSFQVPAGARSAPLQNCAIATSLARLTMTIGRQEPSDKYVITRPPRGRFSRKGEGEKLALPEAACFSFFSHAGEVAVGQKGGFILRRVTPDRQSVL